VWLCPVADNPDLAILEGPENETEHRTVAGPTRVGSANHSIAGMGARYTRTRTPAHSCSLCGSQEARSPRMSVLPHGRGNKRRPTNQGQMRRQAISQQKRCSASSVLFIPLLPAMAGWACPPCKSALQAGEQRGRFFIAQFFLRGFHPSKIIPKCGHRGPQRLWYTSNRCFRGCGSSCRRHQGIFWPSRPPPRDFLR